LFKPGDVINYLDMCKEENTSLQHGMNFRLHGGHSVILMSLRPGAPYADRIEEDGRVLIYEGHDVPRRAGGLDPKGVDQQINNPNGTLTRNGRFYEAAKKYKTVGGNAELVRVYEKIRPGWVYNGLFKLVDSWLEQSGGRKTFKFRLEITNIETGAQEDILPPDHNRLIPKGVMLEVWKRDEGRCAMCGSNENLHFDHIIPYSKGGASTDARNIRLLCARHNILKGDKIE
jgi:hypothetical protein